MTFQVPMNEVAVTVAIIGMEPAEHFIYLHPISSTHDGPETLHEYLNGERSFFPMLTGGVPKMVSRGQILWVKFEKLPDLYESESTLIEKLIIVELVDGSRLEGTVPIDRPAGQSRISDILNDVAEVFVRIDDEGETYYVNKAFIRVVIPR